MLRSPCFSQAPSGSKAGAVLQVVLPACTPTYCAQAVKVALSSVRTRYTLLTTCRLLEIVQPSKMVPNTPTISKAAAHVDHACRHGIILQNLFGLFINAHTISAKQQTGSPMPDDTFWPHSKQTCLHLSDDILLGFCMELASALYF